MLTADRLLATGVAAAAWLLAVTASASHQVRQR